MLMNKSKSCCQQDLEKPKLIRLSLPHGIKSLVCLTVLFIIALYVRDSFIRPTLGDVLVVVWLYYSLASLINMPVKQLAFVAVFIAYLVEIGQYFQITTWLNITPGSSLHVILGATFDWLDLVAYSIGGLLCVWIERK